MYNNYNIRINKLENKIKRKIILIIEKYINDSRFKKINIIRTKLNINNLEIKIFFVLLSNINIEYIINILNNSSNFIRKKLFKILNIKFIPKLVFLYDYKFYESVKIINLINSLKYKNY
ncbi:ribosome-binding factor A [endosymbiont of Euscepes postfasciatus]|uniref:ribosome-binding factor A n=1 Tax=endosymbiont of Euscepes postfasciatus TaxID=650377 RepID=UPI000DC6D799|nr:ribosome-binding factor A [endosymbiont of Euscepes postfasciatus]BBA84572.1 ribosome-binding factor A [endosymbiont of Euscepes postfasciatus]